MNNRLYIGNRIIETPDELKELFGLEDMANPSSSLFNKMIDFVHDGILQEFLRENGETILAMKIGTIDLNASEATIMSDLIFIFTKNVVVVSSNPLDYISILDTKVELRENPLRFVAVFKVGILKKDNRQITMTISQEPARAERMEDIWDLNSFGEFVGDIIKKLLNTKSTRDSDNGQSNSIVENMKLNLNQLQQGKVVLFECDVEKNKNIYFKVGDAVVSKIAAKEVEQLAYQEAIKHNEIKNYLTIFPSGLHASELELPVYEKCNTIDGCKEYLKLYPEGKYAEEIRFRTFLFYEKDSLDIYRDRMTDCNLRFALIKLMVSIRFAIERNGINGVQAIGEKFGAHWKARTGYDIDPEKARVELEEIDQLIKSNASSNYIYSRLTSSVFYKAWQYQISAEDHKLIDRNIRIVFPDINP